MLAVVLLSACDDSSSPDGGSDGGAIDMIDFDAAPGKLGAACDIFGGTRPCDPGLHCTVGQKGGVTADVCVPDAASALAPETECTPIDLGAGLFGDQCLPQHACIAFAGTSRCRALCTRRDDCGVNQACAAPTGSPGLVLNRSIAACVTPDSCDAITKTGCGSGLGCYLSSDNVDRFFTCQSTTGQGATAGQSCKYQRDCAPGLTCTSLGFCRTLCYVAPPQGATVGLCAATEPACQRIAGAPTNYGICDAP